MCSDTDDYRYLFLNDIPMMDVRAPVEYEHGAFPHTVNLPILNNDERHKIGVRYKELGQDAAIALGYELVTDQLKAQRVASWQQFAEAHPDGYLYCFRGGLRSRKTQGFLAEAGVDYPLVKGGYKAMRRFLLDSLEHHVANQSFTVIAGRTGSGKTRVVHAIAQALDLEGIARHRGSSFGRTLAGQPGQIDFENQLSIALLKLTAQNVSSIYLEDESRLIGRCFLPVSMQERNRQSDYVLVEESVQERVAVVVDEYIRQPMLEYQQYYGDDWFEQFSSDLLASLERIRKRLGGTRYQQLRPVMETALTSLNTQGAQSQFDELIENLLNWYYDPMYDFMLQKKQGSCLFKGNRKEVIDWIKARDV